MRILMVSMEYPPVVGGIAAHVYELAHALTARGAQVQVLTRAWEAGVPLHETQDGVEIVRMRLYNPRFTYNWQIARRMNALSASFRPDLVHLQEIRALKATARASVPLVYTNHQSIYSARIARGGRRRARYRRLFARIQLLVGVSKDLLETPFETSVRKAFIPNGVRTAHYARDAKARARLRREMGFSDEDIVGILTRRLHPKNGVIYLARAAQLIQNPRVKLVLIGGGSEYDAIKETFAQHFAGRVHMLGSMRHEEIVPWYSAADFALLPSLMEGAPISALEAMAASLPCVATRVGGLPHTIRDGETGILCAPADEKSLAESINALLARDYVRMGEAACADASARFDWAQIAERTEEAYKELLSGVEKSSRSGMCVF